MHRVTRLQRVSFGRSGLIDRIDDAIALSCGFGYMVIRQQPSISISRDRWAAAGWRRARRSEPGDKTLFILNIVVEESEPSLIPAGSCTINRSPCKHSHKHTPK